MDTTHLVALQQGLSHEKDRLAKAKSEKEIALRTVWVKQYEREIEAEYKFLGMAPSSVLDSISDDDLFAELMA